MWTKASVEKYVERRDGDALYLIESSFPFNKKDKEQIDSWMDDDNLTDSDICDMIYDLAISKCKK